MITVLTIQFLVKEAEVSKVNHDVVEALQKKLAGARLYRVNLERANWWQARWWNQTTAIERGARLPEVERVTRHS